MHNIENPEQMRQERDLKSVIESTHKSKDTEEFLDVIFYRPFGYVMALASKKIGATPNGITIFSIFVGALAGHFFYYNNIAVNSIGILLLIWAEALDSADGQLARMTNNKSRTGRILDGFATNVWFFSIYLHLCLRMINNGESYAIFILALACGLSHSFQSAVADYYRNFYLFFIYGKSKSEIDKSGSIRKEYNKLSWIENFYHKFLMRVYLNYTLEQEITSPRSIRLFDYVSGKYDLIPPEISGFYKSKNKPLVKYYNILTTNTRMIVLFIALLISYIPLFFIFEITLLNFLLAYVIYKHEKNSEQLLNEFSSPEGKE
jgi:phosphatidylglycerophosphate synthase